MKTTQELFASYRIPEKKETGHRNYRDELVEEITDGINSLRKGTAFAPISKRTIALLINRCPPLAKNDGEVAYLLKQCREKNSFAKFFWVTNPKKK